MTEANIYAVLTILATIFILPIALVAMGGFARYSVRRANFELFGVNPQNVSFVPGYFVQSLPPLRAVAAGAARRA